MTRHWLALTFAVLVAAATGCGGEADHGENRTESSARTPNIFFVLLDDADKSMYSKETMPFTWRYMRDHATTFSDYIVTSPLCCPARASIITGQYGHNNGVLENSYGDLQDSSNVLPVWLQNAGYQTAHIGKFLNNYGKTLDDPVGKTPGWDEWFTQLEPQRYLDYSISDNGTRVEFGSRPSDYLTRVLGDRAIDLLRDWDDERPFYLELDEFAPHFAGGQRGRCRGAAEPDPRDFGSFAGAEVPRTPAFFEEDRSDKPAFIQSLPDGSHRRVADEDRRYGCALESLRAVDRTFKDAVVNLGDEGALDTTLIVLSSDNGNYYGQHAIPDEKQFPYRTAYEVPLQISLPAGISPDTPHEVDAPVASIDLAPTFLDLGEGDPCTGEGSCRELDGRSLVPLLTGEDDSSEWSDRVRGIELTLEQNTEPFDRVCEYFGVRSGKWAFVHHVTAARSGGECRPSGEEELYDLAADPYELNNLAEEDQRTASRLLKVAREVRDCRGGLDDSPVGCP